MSTDISVVIPVYMGEGTIVSLVDRIVQAMKSLNKTFEIILINDGSPDTSQVIIQSVCKENEFVKAVLLSRNFGQHYAIHAGLEHSRGKWIVVMDCDLQDDPGEIINLYNKASEGYDIVLAKRVLRKHSFFKQLSSKLFYKVFGYLTDTEQDSSIANFGIYRKKVIDAILDMHDHIRYFPTMVQWIGFSKFKLPVQHHEKAEGTSTYSFKKLMALAYDNIIAFSDKPLRLVVNFGIFISGLSGLMGCFYLYRYFSGEIKILGFASLIISIWFLSGVIIFILGITGIYIGKVFEKSEIPPTVHY